MPRQSISFTPPNDEWLKSQVESEEFASKSDVVNDLIRRAREIDIIRAKLIAAELSAAQSGWVEKSSQDILDGFKQKARQDGKL
jgi:antitoxin ParD1/3/4